MAQKSADIVGLYLNPPQNAIVISIDEKPSIQALSRTTGVVKAPNGKVQSAIKSTYKRNGTKNLFAALEVATTASQLQYMDYRVRRKRRSKSFAQSVTLARS